MLKKVLTVPLAAIVLATTLALAPNTPDLPIISTLEVEPASADPGHLPNVVLRERQRICVPAWIYVYKLVDYETWRYFPDAEPEPRWVIGPWPVYGWRWESVESCSWEWVDVSRPQAHSHISKEICKWLVRAGGFILGVAPTRLAARVIASAAGVSFGEINLVEKCEIKESIILHT